MKIKNTIFRRGRRRGRRIPRGLLVAMSLCLLLSLLSFGLTLSASAGREGSSGMGTLPLLPEGSRSLPLGDLSSGELPPPIGTGNVSTGTGGMITTGEPASTAPPPATTGTGDADSDGLPDNLESDADNDGTLDFLESDSDSDGIPDDMESTALGSTDVADNAAGIFDGAWMTWMIIILLVAIVIILIVFASSKKKKP